MNRSLITRTTGNNSEFLLVWTNGEWNLPCTSSTSTVIVEINVEADSSAWMDRTAIARSKVNSTAIAIIDAWIEKRA